MEVNNVRKKLEVLQKLVQQKVDSAKEKKIKAKRRVKKKSEHKQTENAVGQKAFSDFMYSVAEPITFVEAYEIWNDMCSTNNGEFPQFQNAFPDLYRNSFFKILGAELGAENDDSDCNESNYDSDCDENTIGSLLDETLERSENGMINERDVSSLSDEMLMRFARSLARGIKKTYSIRELEDRSEFKFILCSIALLWLVVSSVAIAGIFYPKNARIGRFTGDTLPLILIESFLLFGVELLWECFLSWIVLTFNIKINYTRKLGNLLKVPKYFIADLFPSFTSTALSMTTALAINQTLFCLMYYRKSRERVPFFAYVFLSQDRREDRPDTLIFQVTEDIMRFAIYFPFKLIVVDLIKSKAIIFIPIAVNNIGDGLAEPVGVTFGKHKYSTTALYHKGKFFKSRFTRSYEGSSCVFITTLLVVAANYHAFNTTQFWITFSALPFLMTIAEAKAPHTNDGPFLALVGCGFLSAIFLIR